MSGNKEKKLLLTTTKQDFIKRMTFHNAEEKRRCNKYLDLKGVSYHVVLANFIGLNRQGKIEYKKVQNLYIYDKRLRNILYKYLAAFEEFIRGYISNKFNNQIDYIKNLSENMYDDIINGSSLSKELENLDLFNLIDIVKKLELSYKEEMFKYTENLDSNLYALKELRNTVSHHRQLFVYEEFEECYLKDGSIGDTLVHNIKNLYHYLPKYYKNFFKQSVNDSCNDRSDPQFKESLPKSAIVTIDC